MKRLRASRSGQGTPTATAGPPEPINPATAPPPADHSTPPKVSPRRRRRFRPGELAKHGVILLVLGLELFPLYVMLEVSVKTNASFVENPWLPSHPSTWQWGNWVYAFDLILPYVANTIFVTVASTVAGLLLAVMGAYFFARYRMPGHRILWMAFLFLFLMPAVINIVPLFSQLKSMHMLNSLWTLVALGVAGGQAFQIYVLRQFIEDIPVDLFAAAEIDGASHWQQVRHVVIPMSLPIIGTLAILRFHAVWNEFLLPLVLLRDRELFTLGVGLIYLQAEYIKDWGRIMAAYAVASLPLIVLFAFTMRWFVQGFSSGAIKG